MYECTGPIGPDSVWTNDDEASLKTQAWGDDVSAMKADRTAGRANSLIHRSTGAVIEIQKTRSIATDPSPPSPGARHRPGHVVLADPSPTMGPCRAQGPGEWAGGNTERTPKNAPHIGRLHMATHTHPRVRITCRRRTGLAGNQGEPGHPARGRGGVPCAPGPVSRPARRSQCFRDGRRPERPHRPDPDLARGRSTRCGATAREPTPHHRRGRWPNTRIRVRRLRAHGDLERIRWDVRPPAGLQCGLQSGGRPPLPRQTWRGPTAGPGR